MTLDSSSKNVLNRHLLTSNNVNDFIQNIEKLENASFTSSEGNKNVFDNFIDTYALLLKDLDVATQNPRSLQDSLSLIKEYLHTVEVMRLTLVFNPNPKFLSSLQELIASKLQYTPIFEIIIDPTILGGLIVDYKGKHIDISLEKLLNSYFEQNKDAILSGL